MFGGMNPAAMMAALRQSAQARPELDRARVNELAPEQAPRETPRWAQALGAAGATMQDMQAAQNGGQGNALDRFNMAQQRMKQARQEATQRSRRFDQLRRSIPASDRQFWDAYALGGDEAALSVLERRNQGRDPVALSAGERLVNPTDGSTIAENPAAERQLSGVAGQLQAAGIDPSSPEGRRMVLSSLQENGAPPGIEDIAVRLVQKIERGEELSPAERQTWERILDYRRQPDAFASMLGGGGSPAPAGNDPVGIRGN